MQKEFTATVYIIHEQKVLLIFHPKFQKWLPPGGHIEINETPAEAAKREVMEEAGIEIEFIQQENVWLNYPHAESIHRPYLCLLENVPEYKDKPAHQHIDFIFIAKPTNPNEQGSADCQWFDYQHIEKLGVKAEIFQDSLDIIKHLMGLLHCTP